MNRCKRLASLAALLLAAGCSRRSADEIVIGLNAELTGDIPAVGAASNNAELMAVADINIQGGLEVAGQRRLVRLVIEDNAGKADQSASAAQKLITQNNVLAIVGPNASRYAIPASEICEAARVVMITPWSTNPKTTVDARTRRPKQ